MDSYRISKGGGSPHVWINHSLHIFRLGRCIHNEPSKDWCKLAFVKVVAWTKGRSRHPCFPSQLSIIDTLFNLLTILFTQQFCMYFSIQSYRQTSDISCTVVGNKIVDHSDVDHSLHFRSQPNTWFQWIGHRKLQDKTKIISVLEFGAAYIRDFTVF